MRRDKIQNEYMFDTKVENIFINEYLISAPGNFIKVYLIALMYADLQKEIDDEKLARNLGLEIDEVTRAWQYWTELGVIRKVKGEIVFPQLKEGIYGKKKSENEERTIIEQSSLHVLDNENIKKMFSQVEQILSRSLNGKETESILDWVETFGASPEIIAFAYKYCVERKKENLKYIGKVVEGWTGRGFETVSQVEEFLAETDQRHYVYKRLMKALGFHRNATEEERRIIDKWFDEMNLSIESILDACKKTSGISNPNINYVNSVLVNWNKDKTGKDENGKVSRRHVLDYYEFIRNKAEEEAKDRKKEIGEGIPQIRKFEEKLNANYVKLTKLAIGGGADKKERLYNLKIENEKINKEIQRILTQNKIPIDYMDIHYKCSLCRDTGSLEDGQNCSCYGKRAEEAGDWTK